MKGKKILGILSFLCMLIMPMYAYQSNNKSVVPEDYLKIMSKADSITVLLLDPWVEDASNWMDGFGEILGTVTIKQKDLIKRSYNLFADPESFKISNLVKNCVHMPDAVIVFHYKNNQIKVSYSFYCDMCRFTNGDDYVEFEGERVRLKFLELVQQAYPKDRYIRYLIKREKSNLK